MRTILLYVTFQLAFLFSSAQNETRWWFFGLKAGVHFQANSVVALPGVSPICNGWGCTSVADSAGNLLFYVDGDNVAYNRLHDTLANGYFKIHKGLQSCYIIRKSGSQYYIIHNDWINIKKPGIPPMLSYSIVDMTLAGGLGSVTVSHQSITPAGLPIVEKMALTRHCNKKDHWILVHKGGYPAGSNEFIAYLVTPTGISTSPVVSAVGPVQLQYGPGSNFYSPKMKISPNGKKVVGLYHNRVVDLYDFDNSTGVVSNAARLDSTSIQTASMVPYPFDSEFSPDGTKLYVSYTAEYSGYPGLFQFDLTKGTNASIAASKTVIDSMPRIQWHGASLQLAADGKIYFGTGQTTYRLNHLGAIQQPNSAGAACLYDSINVILGTWPNSTIPALYENGLPQFSSDYFEQKPSIQSVSFTTSCGLASFGFPTVTAYPATGYSVHSFEWNFGDPLSGVAANSSTLTNPSHSFSSNGTYIVKLVLNYKCGADTLKKQVQVTGLPEIFTTGRKTICKGESTILTFSGTVSSYSLNGNSMPQPSVVLQPSVSTSYTISGADAVSGCKIAKQVSVSVSPCQGITDGLGTDEVQIFPNPHDGLVNINLKEAAVVEIYNALGQLIYKDNMEVGTHSISLEGRHEMLIFYVTTSESTQHIKALSR